MWRATVSAPVAPGLSDLVAGPLSRGPPPRPRVELLSHQLEVQAELLRWRRVVLQEARHAAGVRRVVVVVAPPLVAPGVAGARDRVVVPGWRGSIWVAAVGPGRGV